MVDRRREFAELRRAAQAVLAEFDLPEFDVGQPSLRLLRHEHNTTFRVDAAESRFVLRINRSGVHGPDTIASELAWLAALREQTDLGVPTPVVARSGSTVVTIPGDEPTEATDRQFAVLLRWQDGRFVDRRLGPRHLRQVGSLEAELQQHAATWARPDGFVRPRVDTLTTPAKAASIAGGEVVDARRESTPTIADAEATMTLVDELLSSAHAATVGRALEHVWGTTRELAAEPGGSGLIHGDLHQENFLFHQGAVRAIDFDDCGWGFHLYDLAVTLSEILGRARYPQLRDSLLDGYSRHRSLPHDHDVHLSALIMLRRLQLLAWILESRHHSAFRDRWSEWARDAMAEMTAELEALP